MKLIYAVLFVMLSIGFCFGQKQDNQWYFGQYAGLNFNLGAPVPITTSQINTSEGCASIANKKGRLLFYTDGNTIWDSLNNVMPNGTGLGGNYSTTQSALIVPKPGSDSLYYVFTLASQVGVGSPGDSSLNVNIVDMSLNSGLGDVILLDSELMAPATEKLCGTMACNDTDVWVVAHQWNDNAFYAYRVTSKGISAPVISNTGIVHKDVGSGQNSEAIGYMKISPNGQRLALGCWVDLNTVQIFDFNNGTGVVSNPITDTNYPNVSRTDGPYGLTFSPDNTKLYVGNLNNAGTSDIYQYNLQAGSDTAIINSRTTIATDVTYFYGALQIGPDGKIYVAKYYIGYLDVIDNPNALGASCNYVVNGLSLGNNGQISTLGLPNMIDNYLFPINTATLSYKSCINNAVLAFDSTYSGPIKCYWNFDDPASGTADTSTQQNPTHNFSTGGLYNVSLIVTTPCGIDTIIKTAIADSAPALIVMPQPASVCSGQSIALSVPASGSNYTWSPAATLNTSTGDTVIASPAIQTTYMVTGTDSFGCAVSGSDIVSVTSPPDTPTITQHGDTLISSAKQGNQWARNDTTLQGATNQTYILTISGEYKVVTANPANGCSSTSATAYYSPTGVNQLTGESGQVTVYPNPTDGEFTLNINSSAMDVSNWNLEIYDVLGRTVYSKQALNYNNAIDLSKLSSGVYFICVMNKTSRVAVPVVKQ